MTETALYAGLVLAAVVILVVLEGKRQERIYGKPSARPNLLGVGLLEVQRHLQADRKVEEIRKLNDEDAAPAEEDASGDPARRGPAGRPGRS